MSAKTKLALKTPNGEWSLSLTRALWLGYGIPLSFVLFFLLFGYQGLAIGAILAIVTFKK